MRLIRLSVILFAAALVAVPALADCGAPHGQAASATEAKACCAAAAKGMGCSADCPHSQEALKLAEAAEKGDEAAMQKLIAMVKESGHEDAMTLAGKAEGGCQASQASMIAMVKEHIGGAAQPASMHQLAKAASGGCAKSAASLIAEAKKSEDPKMVDLAKRAEGGCSHSKEALIAMASESEQAEEK